MAARILHSRMSALPSILAIFLLGTAPAEAQSSRDDCGCNAALAKDLSSISISERQQWAFLSLITKETFNQYKQDVSLLASVPIAKQLVEASADFSTFETSRTKYLNQVQYSGSSARDYTELNTVTAAIAYPYWASCMHDCAARNIGLFAFKEKEDKDSVIVSIYYHGAPLGPENPNLKSTLSGGTVDGVPNGRLFRANTTIPKNGWESVIIKRQPGKTVVATISAAGFTARPPIYSTWLESTHPPVEALVRPVYELTPGGFSPKHGGSDRESRHPGCSCGPPLMDVEPTSQNVRQGEPATFKWDGTWICRGQSIKDASGVVWFDGQTTARLPESWGSAKVKYGKPNSYSVQVEYSGTCYDTGGQGCEQHCTTKGTATVNVSEK